MIQQLREAISAGVDGIAMMGHLGKEAIMPLVQAANEDVILMMYQNVDLPAIRATFGGGYVGANLATQGYMLSQEAIRRFDPKKWIKKSSWCQLEITAEQKEKITFALLLKNMGWKYL